MPKTTKSSKTSVSKDIKTKKVAAKDKSASNEIKNKKSSSEKISKPVVKTVQVKKPATKTKTTKEVVVNKIEKKPLKSTEKVLNKTVKKLPVNPPMQETKIAENIVKEDKKICAYCHKEYDKGYTICPHCHRSQKNRSGIIVISVLAFILLFSILTSHFIDNYKEKSINEADYKSSCELVAYEDLVRHPKDYKGQLIKVIGKVISVTGADVLYGNSMVIKINANLFGDNEVNQIEIMYTDKSYNQGFIEGDIITVYGKYEKINGNTPVINTRYITFGE